MAKKFKWNEVNYLLYVRKQEQFNIRKPNVKNIKSFLKTLSTDYLRDLSEQSPRDEMLSQELDKMKREYKDRNAIFLIFTESPYQSTTKYALWLPLRPSRLLGYNTIQDPWQDILNTRYEEFNTLVHVTHIDTAKHIFEENHLKGHQVADNSVFSQVPGHPNESTEVIWFAPGEKDKLLTKNSRYGNVAFSMDKLDGREGLYSKELNYYFVEVIDFKTKSACRILVTPKKYEYLRPYDPTMEGGPWYYDRENKKHYWLRDIKRWDLLYGRNGNSLEILRETNPCKEKDFQRNLRINPVPHLTSERGCLKLGYDCKFIHNEKDQSFDNLFYELAGYYNPNFTLLDQLVECLKDRIKSTDDELGRSDDDDDDSIVDEEEDASDDDSIVSTSHQHKVYQAFLLDIDIKNVNSKWLFWKNIKTSLKRITGQPYSKKVLKAICEEDDVLKSKVLSMIVYIFNEYAEIMHGLFADSWTRFFSQFVFVPQLSLYLTELPYSLIDALIKSSEYFQKQLQLN